MKKFLYLFIIILLQSSSYGILPEFKLEKVEFKIPTNFIHYSEDTNNPSGIYQIEAQIFLIEEKGQMSVEEITSSLNKHSTPWETLWDLLYAYQKKDLNKIKQLYTPDSLDSIDVILSDEKVKQRWIETISSVKKFKIIMGWKIDSDKFYSFVKISDQSLPLPMSFKKVDDKWLLLAGKDTNSTKMSDNLMLFLSQNNITNLNFKILP